MQTRVEAHAKIVAYAKLHPEITMDGLATKLGLSKRTIQNIFKAAGYTRYGKVASLDLDTLLGD